MPETHDGYFWYHWLEDGSPSRIKTVTMDTDITWTAVYEPAPKPVGGKAIPIDKAIIKPELQTPWIWLSTIILPMVATAIYFKHVKRRKKKQRAKPFPYARIQRQIEPHASTEVTESEV